MINIKILLLLPVITSICVLLHGQDNQTLTNYSKNSLIQYANTKYGIDDILVCGIEYRQEIIRANGNPNFETSEPEKTKLFIKGQKFEHIALKYDIYSDLLVLTHINNTGLERQIQLYRSYVDSFSIGNSLFVKIDTATNRVNENKYIEKIYAGGILYLRSYDKQFIKIYDDSNKGKFSKQQHQSFIYTENNFISVNTKKEFLKYYKSFKREIKQFLRKNEIKYKKASNTELSKLMSYCDAKTKATN